MIQRALFLLAACMAAVPIESAAQQAAPAAAPPPPAFAAPNLSEKGVRSMATACAMCHGTNGKPVDGSSVAGLAGRPAAEIVASMNQFKAGTKPATIMHQIARGYGDAETAALADYFSKQR
jgi:cytochrome subunit of sulfide dehydrogenase